MAVKLKITVYVPETKEFMVYETFNKNRSICCPICGRWYSEYYFQTHFSKIHNKYIFKTEIVKESDK